jgi:heme/copper-type cytochrome/quinol oxidase subunit 3
MSGGHDHDDHGHDDHGHDDHGDHGHGNQSRFIQHHYDDAAHQFDAGKFGIWLFLAQEVLFFSALFVAYVLYRIHHPEVFSYAHKWLDVTYGAINTGVLIFSSLTAAWAVRAAQLGQKKLLIGCLAVTIMCACGFLGIKYIEYSHKIHEHILFGRYFDPCVSPGGEELLTKNNECAGTTSTVSWDAVPSGGAGLAGEVAGSARDGSCFEIDKLDLDTKLAGVQADCDVTVVKIDEKGKELGPPPASESPATITNKCPDELLTILNGDRGLAGATGEVMRDIAPKFPCWRPAYQPAVCADLLTADQRIHGGASKPQVGILVEYNDKVEREGLKAKAICKAPAVKPAVTALQIASKVETNELGEKAVHPIHIPTTHEEHEIESLGPPPEHTSMFFTIYFAMTGLHGIHVLVGIAVFFWLLIRAIKGHFTPEYFGPVDFAALYWHIVDLVWIFLFPLLYLIH